VGVSPALKGGILPPGSRTNSVTYQQRHILQPAGRDARLYGSRDPRRYTASRYRACLLAAARSISRIPAHREIPRC
jgi:hypothetical protein